MFPTPGSGVNRRLFERCVGRDDSGACRDLAELHILLRFLRKIDLPRCPDLPPPGDAYSDGREFCERLAFYDEVLFDLLDDALNGGRGKVPTLLGPVLAPEVQLEAARSLRRKLARGMKILEARIDQLEADVAERAEDSA